jgi:SAM-dependent methyltransferase
MSDRSKRLCHSDFRVVRHDLWRGSLSPSQQVLFEKMKPTVDDLARKDDPILYSWYEPAQWSWKRWEYTSVMSGIDLESAAGKRVVDAGCGYTPLIRFLGSIGMEAYGFDLDADPKVSSLPKSATLMHGSAVKYHARDLRNIDWPNDYFDYSISISTLEHLYGGRGFFQRAFDHFLPPTAKVFSPRTVAHCIDEMVRITKPGGRVLLTLDTGYTGIPVPAVERILGIDLSGFPDIETVRSYWASDDYYMHRNTMYPPQLREYTALFVELQKNS